MPRLVIPIKIMLIKGKKISENLEIVSIINKYGRKKTRILSVKEVVKQMEEAWKLNDPNLRLL